MMKPSWRVVLGFLIFGCSAFAESVIEESITGTKSIVIDNAFAAREILWDAQELLVDISPPQMEVFNHRDETIYAVDWRDMPSELKRRMYASMVYGFPVYELRMETDPVFRDTIFKNARGIEVYRLPPPSFKKYDPYAYLKKKFSVSSRYEIDEWTRWIFDWAHTGCTIQMLPKTLHTDFLDELAYRESQEQAIALPMMKMMAMGASDGGEASIPIPVDVVPGSNGTVELWIDAAGSSVRHVEIFSQENLIYPPGWDLVLNNINVTNSLPVVWSDMETNEVMYYYVNNADDDPDSDGYSSLRERLISLTPTNTFNFFDNDNDGLQDWFEIRFWGSITAYDELDDPDNDNLANGVEMAFVVASGITNGVIFYSDPSIPDSDLDGLRDDIERDWHTDAMNSDTDFDGYSDGEEVNGTPPTPRTDPNNSDTTSPNVAFSES